MLAASLPSTILRQYGDAEAGAPLPGNTPRSPGCLVSLLRGSPTCFPRRLLCWGVCGAPCLFLVWKGSWRTWGLCLGAPLTQAGWWEACGMGSRGPEGRSVWALGLTLSSPWLPSSPELWMCCEGRAATGKGRWVLSRPCCAMSSPLWTWGPHLEDEGLVRDSPSAGNIRR